MGIQIHGAYLAAGALLQTLLEVFSRASSMLSCMVDITRISDV